MREGASSPYTDAKDILNHLKTIYEDPNQITTAKNQFHQLYMKNVDKFYDFLSEFLYLAAEVEVLEDSWKDELYHQITTELQKLTMTEKLKGGSFQEFSNLCSQIAGHLEAINHQAQRSCTFAPTKTSQTTQVKKETTPGTPQSNGAPMTEDLQECLMKEG
ncbi:hypothetical protein MAP00_006541 [Monascus purpureus]|nr:hypothetical protein MAP00_006541 [Monascus purpureus]